MLGVCALAAGQFRGEQATPPGEPRLPELDGKFLVGRARELGEAAQRPDVVLVAERSEEAFPQRAIPSALAGAGGELRGLELQADQRGLLKNGVELFARKFLERTATISGAAAGTRRAIAAEPLGEFAQRRIEAGFQRPRLRTRRVARRRGSLGSHHVDARQPLVAKSTSYFHIAALRGVGAELHYGVAEVWPGLAVEEARVQHSQ